MTRTCACGRRFTPRVHNQTHCSRKCRSWHRATPLKPCQDCGTPHTATAVRCADCYDSQRQPASDQTKVRMRASAAARYAAMVTITEATIAQVVDLREQGTTLAVTAAQVGLTLYMTRQLWIKHRRTA